MEGYKTSDLMKMKKGELIAKVQKLNKRNGELEFFLKGARGENRVLREGLEEQRKEIKSITNLSYVYIGISIVAVILFIILV